jgi:hypothetical membrane protein
MNLKSLFSGFPSPKTAGLCGMLAPLAGLVFVSLAILSSPWFSWTENWISDMGGSDGERPIWSARGTESVLLNVGLVVTGTLGTVFALGVGKIRFPDTITGRRGAQLLFVDMVAMIMVGVFPMSLQALHYIVALAFFLLLPFTLLALGRAFGESTEPELGRLIHYLGISTLCLSPLLAVPRPWGGNAVAELFPAAAMGLFSILIGFHMWKGRFDISGKECAEPACTKREEVQLNA